MLIIITKRLHLCISISNKKKKKSKNNARRRIYRPQILAKKNQQGSPNDYRRIWPNTREKKILRAIVQTWEAERKSRYIFEKQWIDDWFEGLIFVSGKLERYVPQSDK